MAVQNTPVGRAVAAGLLRAGVPVEVDENVNPAPIGSGSNVPVIVRTARLPWLDVIAEAVARATGEVLR